MTTLQEEILMSALLSLQSALGLSTAAGLNAYIPLLAIGLAARYTDLISLNSPYDLLTNPIVLIVIGIFAILDFIGDKIPAIDHILHAVGVIVHPVAGALAFMAANSTTGTIDPTLAAICGLILAGGMHGTRTAVRPVATTMTGGVGNPVISFIEDIVSLVLVILSILVPVLAFVLVVFIAFLVISRTRRFLRQRTQSKTAT